MCVFEFHIRSSSPLAPRQDNIRSQHHHDVRRQGMCNLRSATRPSTPLHTDRPRCPCCRNHGEGRFDDRLRSERLPHVPPSGSGRMTDIVESKRRSELMAGIGRHDSAPEVAVRRVTHKIGLSSSMRHKDLLGCPTRMKATMDKTMVRPHTARMPQARPFRSRAISMVAVPVASLPRCAILREHRFHPDVRGVAAYGRFPSTSMRRRRTMTILP